MRASLPNAARPRVNPGAAAYDPRVRVGRPLVTDLPAGRRVSATVTWEGRHRGPSTMWFEVDAPFAADLDPTSAAFAVAALPLAVGLHEPRLVVEGALCPKLHRGLGSAASRLARWYRPCAIPTVTATDGPIACGRRTPPRAGLLVSGGVDSLSLLRRNRAEVPIDHPRAFRDALFLFGWHSDDFDGDRPRPERLALFAAQRARLEGLAAATGLTLVPVRSNVRTFHPTYAWSRDFGFGAGMLAAVHLFARRWSEVSIASGGFPGVHPPHASHPDLDGCWSSAAVAVRHGEPDRTRFEKLRALVDWPPGLAVLDVCLHHDAAAGPRENCGRCEKCLRTRLALTALGAEGRAPTFPPEPPSVEEVRGLRLPAGFSRAFVKELAAPLAARGRADLVAALEVAVARAEAKDRRRNRPWRLVFREVRRRWRAFRGSA